ncbi:SNF2-related protein [Cyanobium gracile UHCC 0139]|uniref:SNF2-related protein n=1 Tax=Cyanobium gracile UHCC 0139 TaxID=3110308 RepID=A0ABU5RU69_9CYAN|nr:SNF2-related protein [Cyanobium gracile]MEA5391298.1 SNF2-related protein [Cyanobium gracile UHCC 0139]
MNSQHTDLTFFTNGSNQTLLDRFKATLADTHLFDVLVGYFRASGFYQLYDSIEPVEKTRILVGLGIDDESNRAIHAYRSQTVLDFESHKSAKDQFQQNLIEEIEQSEEADDKLELGLKKFIEFLKTECADSANDRNLGGNGRKLEIRAFPSRNIHAKVYIGRFAPDDRDYGFVVTGSSNFSYSGLVANREFNVELRQRRDVEYALEQFEDLWRQSVDISDDFVDAVQNKTWLNDSITPYELYLKLIYEYLQEDINLQDDIEVFLPEGFMLLQYQQQAVQQAIKKLKEHNGVFLADVVGLGKTFIAAQLLQQLKGRALVICPPVLKSYWEESLHDFRVPARVESLGKLEKVIKFGLDRFDYVVVDEAHRFRNERTRSYADLHDICRGKKVILVTATPLNNTIDDIIAQLKLFQVPKNSTIPGIPNLERFFASLRGRFKGLDRTDPAYKEAIKSVSREIRERILKQVMVRRTRSDVMTYFKKDTESQGLFFPEVQDPRRIIYEFEGELEATFNQTIGLLQNFRHARYIPLLYYSGSKQLSEFERQQQRNVGGFMKGILIKRLESSFYAFRKSIRRFIESYERFIGMYEGGTVYISKHVDVYDLLDNDDIDVLEKYVEEEKAVKYAAEDFRGDFGPDLHHDLELLRQVEALWKHVGEDPKLDAFSKQLKTDRALKERLVVFTESKETGDYLFDELNRQYPGRVMFFSSQGGRAGYPAVTHNPALARDLINAAFDPNQKEYDENLRILITTDVLSEGINLHRGNVLINYDLPWNPTRVLQRAGRVNRLGTVHPDIFIYNFFPTTQADVHLGLEANVTNKIQMFHDILGEDAKYLSDGEEIGSQELFETLNRKQIYTGEEEEGDSELKYLELMRTLRDEQPELFEKIKRLPKKARSGRSVEGLGANQLVSFFRIGPLKKFYCTQEGESGEITFIEAVNLLACLPDTPRHSIPKEYYHWLEMNKQRFALDSVQEEEPAAPGGGRSNASYIEKRLKDKVFRSCKKFTDADEEFLDGVRKMIAQGLMAKKTAQTIKKAFEKTLDPLELLAILRKHIRAVDEGNAQPQRASGARREIILSGCQIAAGGK